MRILYIDTSSSYLYAGISYNDKLIGEIKEEYGHKLSEMALSKIVDMLNKANVKPEDITKIIVVNGPGSFTGIRIGITIAKVMAWSLNIPISTISALDAMRISINDNYYVVPILNARREYVFAAIYDNNGIEVLEPQHIKIEQLKDKLKEINNYKLISNDEELNEYFDEIVNYDPNIMKIIKETKNYEELSPHAVNPKYLKLTEAEEKLK